MADDTQSQVKDVLSDDKFRGLPYAEQVKVLKKLDPQFGNLPDHEQSKVIVMGTAPKLPAPPNMIERDIQKKAITPLSHVADFMEEGVIKGAQAVEGMGRTAVVASEAVPPGIGTPSNPAPAAEAGEASLKPIKEAVSPDSVLTEAGPVERTAGAASSVLGGDPESARGAFAAGEIGRGVADIAAVPLATMGIGHLLKMVPGLEDTRVPAAATRRQVESLASIITRGVREGEPQMVAQTVQPLYKQAAQELKVDPSTAFPTRETAPQSDLVGNLRRGGRTAVSIADRAVDIADRPLSKTVETFAKESATDVQQKVLADLEQSAKSYDGVNPQLATAIRGLKKQVVANGRNVGGLNELKVMSNKKITDLFKTGDPSKAIAADAHTAYAYRVLGDSIRANLYPRLEELGGPQLRPYVARESAAIQARDGVYSAYYKEAAPEQANQAALTYLEHIAHGSFYDRALVSRALKVRPMAVGEFNRSFRRGVGDLGEGMVPEQVEVSKPRVGTGPPSDRLLPAPPGRGSEPFKFTIPGDIPTEVTEGSSVVPAGKRYAGTETVPREGYESTSQVPTRRGIPSHFKQRQELGTTAETIPEAARGRRTGPQARADQLGSSQHAVPEESFTGPETTTRSKWQYVTSTDRGPTETVSTTGPGTLHTSDIKVAESTLKRMQQHYNRLKTVGNPPYMARLQSAIETLQTQIQQYHAYEGQQSPGMIQRPTVKVRPGRPGTVKRTTRMGRYGGAAAASRAGMVGPPKRSTSEDEEPDEE